MQHHLQQIFAGNHLTEDEAQTAMQTIMDGQATGAQIGALLAALRMKGETVDEITGFARVMRQNALAVPTTRTPLVDTCGTGGDTVKTFNVSTGAAFVAACGGAHVAKHGNRSVTSRCGSADVLEALQVRLDLTVQAVGECVDAVGIGFLFARTHHPAMRHAAGPRAEMGVRTVFNALGPLTNPAGATRQIVGVYDPALCPILARVLLNLGAEHVLVVHGEAGLDEIATFGTTLIAEGRAGEVKMYRVTPEDLGLTSATPEAVAPASDANGNAELLRAVLSGKDDGPRCDIVQANAGAALYVAGVAESLADGVQQAGKILASGAAWRKVETLRNLTQSFAPVEHN